MDKRWFELQGKDLPADTTFGVICPIVKPGGVFGGSWKNLPTFPGQAVFGWNSQDSSISVLDSRILVSYDPNSDPKDYNVLFDLEADYDERRFKAEGKKLLAAGSTKEGAQLVARADDLFVRRVFRFVQLVSRNGFEEPGDTANMILVHSQSSGLVRDQSTIRPEAVDRGSIIYSQVAPPVDKVRLSVRDKMNKDLGK